MAVQSSNVWRGIAVLSVPTLLLLGYSLLRHEYSTEALASGVHKAKVSEETVAPLPSLSVGIPPSPETNALMRSAADADIGTVRVADISSSVSSSRSSFDMSHVESFRLRVLGLPELSGEYTIDADGLVGIPGLSRVQTGTLSLAEFETELTRRIRTFSRRDLFVSVEVAKYKPFYIMGGVVSPGAYPWRPGLTLVQSVALGGGLGKGAAGLPDLGDGRSSMRQNLFKLHFLLTQLSRLQAAKDGRPGLTITERHRRVIQSDPVLEATAFSADMAQHAELLAGDRKLFSQQLEALQQERAITETELENYLAAAESMEKQFKISQTFLDNMKELHDKKAIPTRRYLEQQSQSLGVQVQLTELRGHVERARLRLTGIVQRIGRAHQEHEAQLNERIMQIEREAVQIEVALADMQGGEGQLVNQSSNGEFGHFQIRSKSGNPAASGAVTSMSLVMPGDVVIVGGGVAAPSPANNRPRSAMLGANGAPLP